MIILDDRRNRMAFRLNNRCKNKMHMIIIMIMNEMLMKIAMIITVTIMRWNSNYGSHYINDNNNKTQNDSEKVRIIQEIMYTYM